MWFRKMWFRNVWEEFDFRGANNRANHHGRPLRVSQRTLEKQWSPLGEYYRGANHPPEMEEPIIQLEI